MQHPSKAIIERIEKLGFSDFGIVDLDTYDAQAGEGLAAYVEQGHHGEMAWLKETLERRTHPQAMWPDARSALVLAMNYGPDCDPLKNLQDPKIGNISVYARNRDYHDLIKGRLKEIANLLARETGADVKVFVDTAPLMEKPLAAKAGLGWQGKHTNLVSREFGSWLFLGVILCAARLEPTLCTTAECGTCTACLDICPTKAFPHAYKIDARLCISYLTIELKDPVDIALRPKLGNRIYGCDDCLAICPWNKYAKMSHEIKLRARHELNAPPLKDLVKLDDREFRVLFSGSPIKRIGVDRFLRNVLYAIGNSGDPSLIPSAQNHLESDDPVVRDAAQWAISRLS
ncbi:MAG TPA: tRNA epoxyqueuosine(34) reductase QueG [Hellea balneolensis]|uniref:tRNA epoxyqueuosine(34) reductase QueG n=1 Tax=Hellea balneolensis TaxID=287478 RepID=A0A7C5LZ19_9PROT|nr:tRNA epoxyqueuosine(34) reductase QueG [Hellea balneolensis]